MTANNVHGKNTHPTWQEARTDLRHAPHNNSHLAHEKLFNDMQTGSSDYTQLEIQFGTGLEDYARIVQKHGSGDYKNKSLTDIEKEIQKKTNAAAAQFDKNNGGKANPFHKITNLNDIQAGSHIDLSGFGIR